MEPYIYLLIAILGLVFGSFYACMGYRIPNKISTIAFGSFCPLCKTPLKWYMNIPVLSFIFLKGKCAYCKKPINYIYPFVELSTSLLFLCNYIMFDFTLEFWIAMIVTGALMVTIVSDFMYYYISDRVLLISGLAFIIVRCIYMDLNDVYYYIISGVILFVMMLLVKWLGNKIFKRESLGDGDIKLMGIVGIGLGLINGLVSLAVGSLIGLVFSFAVIKKNKDGIIPFGPFILIGALMTLYFYNLVGPLLESLFKFV